MLRADRPSPPASPHLPWVLIAGQRVELPAGGAAEQRDEHALAELGDLPDGGDPNAVQPPRRHRPDAPETLDLERVQEGELALGRHHQQPVRLGDPARDLGEELRPRDADRDRQAYPLAHLPPQQLGHRRRRPGQPAHAADVQERLVDREALDPRRGVLEDLVDVLARLGVGGHPRLDHHRGWAQAQRARNAHRGADAAALRLVAGREHDPRADDHRPAPQPRVVALLDRREEGVEVRVQDRGLTRHEHMFAGNAGGRNAFRFSMAKSWSAELELKGAGGEPVDLRRTLASHGVADLPPNEVDAQAGTLTTTLALPRGATTVRVSPGRKGFARVEGTGPSAGAVETVRHLLRLDADLSAFYAVARRTRSSAGRPPGRAGCCAARRSSRTWSRRSAPRTAPGRRQCG